MPKLDIKHTELMDLVDEKIAAKDLSELENFIANTLNGNGDKSADLLLKSNKKGCNNHAKISKEFIALMMKILQEIKQKKPVTIAGKKSRITAQQAMNLIDVNLDGFNKMIDDKVIKCHHIKKQGYYVNMEDIPKGKKLVRESREEMLKKFAQDMQAEMAENAA